MKGKLKRNCFSSFSWPNLESEPEPNIAASINLANYFAHKTHSLEMSKSLQFHSSAFLSQAAALQAALSLSPTDDPHQKLAIIVQRRAH